MNQKYFNSFINNNMTEQLDPSSVLAYLNEMGYYNISTHQLKEFLKDLRKLMKYEENFNFQSNNNNYTKVVLEKSEQLYSTQTVSSKAKTTSRYPADISKTNQIIDTIKKSKNLESLEKKSIREPAKSLDDKPICLSNVANKQTIRQCQSLPSKSVTSKKSIPRTVASTKNQNTHLETDPVVLYHQYKKEWERKKIPGENNHSRLRWKIRQKICQL